MKNFIHFLCLKIVHFKNFMSFFCFFSHCFAELGPVSAIVGGVLGQEIIKVSLLVKRVIREYLRNLTKVWAKGFPANMHEASSRKFKSFVQLQRKVFIFVVAFYI